ncbi:MAG: hypothetical protein KAT04_08730 [Methylococcales bacterium]|nr:hypothetical protein [Methylococcales bacterium]
MDTMKPAKFQIIYDGPALDAHEMNVNDLAPALLAIGDLMSEVGGSLHGEKLKISVSVKGSFKTGCFGVEMVASAQNIFIDAIDIFNHGNATALLNIAGLIGIGRGATGSLIGLVKWLKNRKISKTEVISDGIVRIFIDNEHYDVEQEALSLLQNYKIRKALEDIVSKPLSREGVDSFAITDPQNPDDPIFVVDKNEAIYFVAPEPGNEVINDQTTTVSLQIVSPAFVEGNKWRFSDGVQTFYAEIKDDAFLKRVQDSEEVFAKSDILTVKMQLVQWITAKGMKSEYFILEVIKHRSSHRQIDIFK